MSSTNSTEAFFVELIRIHTIVLKHIKEENEDKIKSSVYLYFEFLHNGINNGIIFQDPFDLRNSCTGNNKVDSIIASVIVDFDFEIQNEEKKDVRFSKIENHLFFRFINFVIKIVKFIFYPITKLFSFVYGLLKNVRRPTS